MALIGWAFWGPGLSWAHTQGVRARTQALPPPHRQASAPGATRPPRRPAFRAAQGLEPGGQHAPAAVTGAQGWQQRRPRPRHSCGRQSGQRAHPPARRSSRAPAGWHRTEPSAPSETSRRKPVQAFANKPSRWVLSDGSRRAVTLRIDLSRTACVRSVS